VGTVAFSFRVSSLLRWITRNSSAAAPNFLLRSLRHLSDLGDITAGHCRRAVIPSIADEGKHIGDLLVVQDLGVLRHRICGRNALNHEVMRAVQRHIDQRRGIFFQHVRIAGERRQEGSERFSIDAMTMDAIGGVDLGARISGGMREKRDTAPWIERISRRARAARCRQRLQIRRHRRDIVIIECLRAVIDHVRHRSERGRVRVRASLHEPGEFRFRPSAESDVLLARKIRGEPAVKRTTCQPRAAAFVPRLFLERDATWRVARAAMSEALNQIRTAIPSGILAIFIAVDGFVEEDHVPERQRPAHVERERDIGRAIGLVDRRHALHEIRVERSDVVIAHLRVGRIGHGRIEIVAILRYAAAQRFVEIRLRPFADARPRVRRDVGRVDLPHRRGHREAAGERLALGCRVASDTIAGRRKILAARDERAIGRSRQCKKGPCQRDGDEARHQCPDLHVGRHVLRS